MGLVSQDEDPRPQWLRRPEPVVGIVQRVPQVIGSKHGASRSANGLLIDPRTGRAIVQHPTR